RAGREAHAAVESEVVAFGLRLAQSEALYRALVALREGPAWDGLDAAQRRIVDCLLRDARLAGVALSGAARERFNQLQQELAECSTQFSNHVLHPTQSLSLALRPPAEH